MLITSTDLDIQTFSQNSATLSMEVPAVIEERWKELRTEISRSLYFRYTGGDPLTGILLKCLGATVENNQIVLPSTFREFIENYVSSQTPREQSERRFVSDKTLIGVVFCHCDERLDLFIPGIDAMRDFPNDLRKEQLDIGTDLPPNFWSQWRSRGIVPIVLGKEITFHDLMHVVNLLTPGVMESLEKGFARTHNYTSSRSTEWNRYTTMKPGEDVGVRILLAEEYLSLPRRDAFPKLIQEAHALGYREEGGGTIHEWIKEVSPENLYSLAGKIGSRIDEYTEFHGAVAADGRNHEKFLEPARDVSFSTSSGAPKSIQLFSESFFGIGYTIASLYLGRPKACDDDISGWNNPGYNYFGLVAGAHDEFNKRAQFQIMTDKSREARLRHLISQYFRAAEHVCNTGLSIPTVVSELMELNPKEHTAFGDYVESFTEPDSLYRLLMVTSDTLPRSEETTILPLGEYSRFVSGGRVLFTLKPCRSGTIGSVK